MQQFQNMQLVKVLNAAKNIPMYKDAIPQDISKEDLYSILENIPVLDRQMVREYYDYCVRHRNEQKEYVIKSTSGTTGRKLVFMLNRELAYNINYALLWRAYNWSGIRLGDRRVTIGGRVFTQKPPFWVVNKAENQLLLSIHHLNNRTVDSYLEQIERFSPKFIQGHPSGIHYIARRALDSGRRIKVKAIFTTGETLGDMERQDISEAFGAVVCESYGMGEQVIAAQQCPRGSFHEICELGLWEFELDSTTGLYRVLGTSLWNTVMPFIRYKIEDLFELQPEKICPCGITLPVRIRRIIGRIDDILTDTNGETILPVTVRMIIKPLLLDGETYQVRQIGDGQYNLLVTGDLDDQREDRLRHALCNVLGTGAHITVKRTDTLFTQGGKIRNVVNYRQKFSKDP